MGDIGSWFFIFFFLCGGIGYFVVNSFFFGRFVF